jgi:N6-L-threonylcarbamoyladenine synthase
MGLGYPGGRVIDELSKSANPKAIRFPRARMKKGAHEFSFSGLKTAVWHYLKEQGGSAAPTAEVAASFQEAVVDMLVAPTMRAAVELDVKRIVLAGGVAANSRLRKKMTAAAASEGLELHVPPPALCTDNGAMIALAGYHMLRRGLRDDLYLNADADLTL